MTAWHWGHWWLTLLRRFMKKGMRQQPAMHLYKWDKCPGLNTTRCFLTKSSSASSSYPSMQHRLHMVHVALLTLLLVPVFTTSLQEGHWVMADRWPKLSTCAWERRRLTVCSAIIGHVTFPLLWVQVSLTWSHSRCRHHGASFGSGLLTQLFVFLVKLWQQVDPPTGSGTFHSRLTWIRFTRNKYLNNLFNDFL